MAPASMMDEIASGAAPELGSVALWGCLVFLCSCEPKARAVGVSMTAGCVPVPLKGRLWGLLGASSVIVTLAGREPAALGRRETRIVQLAPAASVCGGSGQSLEEP